MAPVTRGRALLEDVDNRKEPVQEEQLTAFQAHPEAQFVSLREQIEALTKLMSNESGWNRRRHIPSSYELEEEDAHVEDEDENPFAELGVHGHQPLEQAQANRWESSFKLNISEFNGGLQPKKLLDWIAVVKEVLEFKGYPRINEFLWSQPNSGDELQRGGSNWSNQGLDWANKKSTDGRNCWNTCGRPSCHTIIPEPCTNNCRI